MSKLTRLGTDTLVLESELGSVMVKTSLSDQNVLLLETDLALVTVRMRVKDQFGELESVLIEAKEGVEVEGDTCIVLRKR